MGRRPVHLGIVPSGGGGLPARSTPDGRELAGPPRRAISSVGTAEGQRPTASAAQPESDDSPFRHVLFLPRLINAMLRSMIPCSSENLIQLAMIEDFRGSKSSGFEDDRYRSGRLAAPPRPPARSSSARSVQSRAPPAAAADPGSRRRGACAARLRSSCPATSRGCLPARCCDPAMRTTIAGFVMCDSRPRSGCAWGCKRMAVDASPTRVSQGLMRMAEATADGSGPALGPAGSSTATVLVVPASARPGTADQPAVLRNSTSSPQPEALQWWMTLLS